MRSSVTQTIRTSPANAGVESSVRVSALTPAGGTVRDVLRLPAQHYRLVNPGTTLFRCSQIRRSRSFDVARLVWFEGHESLEATWLRERQLKKWRRDWKIDLIERDNPRLSQ